MCRAWETLMSQDRIWKDNTVSSKTHVMCLPTFFFIVQAQPKAGRPFMEAIYPDETSINRHITLDPYYDLIKDRLIRWIVLIYYKNICKKIYKRWRSGLATWPMKAPSKKWMSCYLLPAIATYHSRRRYSYSAFANSCPLQTDTFLFPLIHSHNVLLSSNKF